MTERQILSPPYLCVFDCSEPPPEEVSLRLLGEEFVRWAQAQKLANHYLWSRLILLSVRWQQNEENPPQLSWHEDRSWNLRLAGNWHRYCNIDISGKLLALLLTTVPGTLSFKQYDLPQQARLTIRRTFPVLFNDWIDRQENPTRAFYQIWTTQLCLQKRDDPALRAVLSDGDNIAIRGPTQTMREMVIFWSSPEWICTTMGAAISTLYTEVRTAEKTLQLLAHKA